MVALFIQVLSPKSCGCLNVQLIKWTGHYASQIMWLNVCAVDETDGARVWMERLGAAGLMYDDEEEEWEDNADDDEFGEGEGEEGVCPLSVCQQYLMQ